MTDQNLKENTACVTCLKTKAPLSCGLCHQSLCKSCAQFVDENTFSYLSSIPEHLSHTVYCGHCFDEKVAADLAQYNQTMEDAKNISVFSKTQSKETRFISRKEALLKVSDCADEAEATLRFAFLAAQAKFNAIIDLELSFKKVKQGSYQHLSWSGTARPANVDPTKLMRDRAIWDNPN